MTILPLTHHLRPAVFQVLQHTWILSLGRVRRIYPRNRAQLVPQTSLIRKGSGKLPNPYLYFRVRKGLRNGGSEVEFRNCQYFGAGLSPSSNIPALLGTGRLTLPNDGDHKLWT